ncbi:MAG: KTSC domain-containing protein [Flavobacterium sp.]|nr:KTSC domain-containing protein [Flavobacterium sp.]
MKIFYTLLLLFLISNNSYSQNNCDQLPYSFSSYNEALKLVGNAKFSFVDYLNTSKSTVIQGAKYYSCDNKSGFMIIGVNNQRYIHQGVPINVWNNFKTAGSFGSFYNIYIKNNYQLSLK